LPQNPAAAFVDALMLVAMAYQPQRPGILLEGSNDYWHHHRRHHHLHIGLILNHASARSALLIGPPWVAPPKLLPVILQAGAIHLGLGFH
jgi:hypothetical protein